MKNTLVGSHMFPVCKNTRLNYIGFTINKVKTHFIKLSEVPQRTTISLRVPESFLIDPVMTCYWRNKIGDCSADHHPFF